MLHIEYSVPPKFEVKSVLKTVPKKDLGVMPDGSILMALDFGPVIRNLVFSSSGVGKFVLFKNNEPLAVMFSNTKNLNCQYKFPIAMDAGDELSVKITNRDLSACDFYVGWTE